MAPAENLLQHETSPYLLQHASNPVHWRPWGEAALAEARALDRPILLSVGYAACHWCHVMAHESFEDAATAALMNRLFVNVKVDREERPDIDHLYMSALHALGEHGGWPMTMFLTPEGEPFWGGTYFPPEPRWGRPSFRQVLQGVAEAYQAQRDAVRQNADALRQALAAQSAARPGAEIEPATLDQVTAALLQATDPEQGGMRGAPKFPNAPIFRYLWQDGFRTGGRAGIEALHLLLRRMSLGGIHDHLGGGYARYATDAVWLVPHFEKMLYDNAQLLELLALAAADRPDPLYAACAAATVGWMLRDMAAPVGGGVAFAASEDADSEGEEGRFYVWTEAEIDALLGPDSAAFKQAYDVTPVGNWEGRTILRRVTPTGDAMAEAGLARSRDILLAARARRVRPGRDDKVLADWNGLVIAALCRAGAVFDRPEWIAHASAAFDAVMAAMAGPDGRVRHVWRLGRSTAAGLLDDQAAMARAALALFEAGGEARRLDQARHLVAAAQARFGDHDGSFFATADDATDVPLGAEARPRTAIDTATPSGNGMLAEVLARLFHLTGDPDFATRARRLVAAFGGLGNALASAPTLLAAADLLEDGALVVIAGDPVAGVTQALLRTALAAPDPALAVLRAGTVPLPPDHPAHGKTAPAGEAVAYLCRGGVCAPPVADPAALAALLRHRRGPT
ncbi:Thymidylate kinase [Rhodovastum atsumiense]|uniref:Thioredoxin domain-containing protein n=1 Tax=Rhodovastum atsumiense TaxID=504468 RepID=A0A5M6IQY0_9PROT|nr:thioredoxin domain-containing protein [Rhodovastum atsumiense]KAA5610357.1 thioredoxin domain-containing protein [Rhodovastum atsumiense]CAH2600899.1 Thymidylate kinase [Rhodovastum atsumiense]